MRLTVLASGRWLWIRQPRSDIQLLPALLVPSCLFPSSVLQPRLDYPLSHERAVRSRPQEPEPGWRNIVIPRVSGQARREVRISFPNVYIFVSALCQYRSSSNLHKRSIFRVVHVTHTSVATDCLTFETYHNEVIHRHRSLEPAGNRSRPICMRSSGCKDPQLCCTFPSGVSSVASS